MHAKTCIIRIVKGKAKSQGGSKNGKKYRYSNEWKNCNCC